MREKRHASQAKVKTKLCNLMKIYCHIKYYACVVLILIKALECLIKTQYFLISSLKIRIAYKININFIYAESVFVFNISRIVSWSIALLIAKLLLNEILNEQSFRKIALKLFLINNYLTIPQLYAEQWNITYKPHLS